MQTPLDATDSRRNQILEAAAGVFLRYGYARTTMNDIAGAVGCSRTLLYVSFANKDEVFEAVVVRASARAIAAIREGLPSIGSLEARLLFVCEEWMAKRYDLVKAYPDAKDLFDLSFSAVKKMYVEFQDLLFELLNELNAGGSDGGANLGSLMANDGEDVCRGDDLGGGGDDVTEERLATDFVEDFGAAGFEAGSLAGGHDDYGQMLACFHGVLLGLSLGRMGENPGLKAIKSRAFIQGAEAPCSLRLWRFVYVEVDSHPSAVKLAEGWGTGGFGPATFEVGRAGGW